MYAVVERGGIELHLFAMKGYGPADSDSSCYVWKPDVDVLDASLRAGLKQAFGRIPKRPARCSMT